MTIIEKVCDKISSTIAEELNMDDEKKAVVHYGVFAVIQISLSILCTLIVGAVLGVFVESLIISLIIVALRKASGGIHARTPNQCIVIGAVIISAGGLLCKASTLSAQHAAVIEVVIFLGAFAIMAKYAPSDSKAKPITKDSERKRLKQKSIVTLFIYCILVSLCFIVYYYNNNYNLITYALCICFGTAWQSFTLTKTAHMIF